MSFTKFMVLAGGVLGLVSFFMPYFVMPIEGSDSTVNLSPYVGFVGISAVEEVAEGAEVEAASALGADKAPAAAAAMKEANDMLDSIKMFLLIPVAPAIFLLLFGLLGLKGAFGRGLGAGSLLFGLVALAIWGLLSAALGEVDGEVSGGLGLTLLMACGALGAVGGLLALIKPERRAA